MGLRVDYYRLHAITICVDGLGWFGASFWPMKFHLESLSNGLGAQSMLLLEMACKGEIPAKASITADTGWESDRTWSNGRRGPIIEYFNEIVVPMCRNAGIEARFVRTVDRQKQAFIPLLQHVEECAAAGRVPNIPMFGSRKGRLRQVCTDKWKIRALRQEARRMGASTNCNAQGIHAGEADRRMRGRFLKMSGKWSIFQTTVPAKSGEKDIKWQTHYYPLVDLRYDRNECQRRVAESGIPYLLSSECDGCPHKDLERWERTDPAVIKSLSELESKFNGEYFFTDRRVPLIEAIELMRKSPKTGQPDFGCLNAICGV